MGACSSRGVVPLTPRLSSVEAASSLPPSDDTTLPSSHVGPHVSPSMVKGVLSTSGNFEVNEQCELIASPPAVRMETKHEEVNLTPPTRHAMATFTRPPPSPRRRLSSELATTAAADKPMVDLAPEAAASHSVDLSAFAYVASIGSGGHGAVLLMRRKADNQPTALKVTKRESVTDPGDRIRLLSERRLLASLSHPMVAGFVCAFKDSQRLYLAMEYVGGGIGGDLQGYFQARRVISLAEHQLILASATLMLEYLHGRGVVHRDLKKENLMVTSAGYLKLIECVHGLKLLLPCVCPMRLPMRLRPSPCSSCQPLANSNAVETRHCTSFGCAKELGKDNGERTYSVCGTPSIMAPERLDPDTGHGLESDWWSLGVLSFECCYSESPFRMFGAECSTLTQCFTHIMDPEYMPNLLEEMKGYPGSTPQALALIGQLMEYEPEERAGAAAVRSAGMLEGFDWEALCSQQLPEHARLKIDAELTAEDPFEHAQRVCQARRTSSSGGVMGSEEDEALAYLAHCESSSPCVGDEEWDKDW